MNFVEALAEEHGFRAPARLEVSGRDNCSRYPEALLKLPSGLQALIAYQRAWLIPDVVAGLVLTAFLIPVGMGYAQAAGLPAISGLYATIVPLLLYAVVGPSRVMVLGPDSSLAALIATVVMPLAQGSAERAVSLAAALSLATGTVILLLGLLRFGFVTELLSRPVQRGYLAAVALMIGIGQVPKLLGMTIRADGVVPQLRETWFALVDSKWNGSAFAIGSGAIMVMLLCRRFAPRASGPFVALVVGVVVSGVASLEQRGVRVIGALPQGFPAFDVPNISYRDASALLSGAVGIALVAVADTTVLSKSLSQQQREETSPDQELIALGAANIGAGLFSGFPISSSASRTPVAIDAGAKTQLTGVVGAISILGLLWLAPQSLHALPQPVLAGIVLVAAAGLVSVVEIRKLYKSSRLEFGLMAAAFVGVVFAGVLQGIFLAVILSLGDFVRRAWRPHDAVLGRVHALKGYHDISRYPDAQQIPGLVLYRFDAPLFFANAEHFRNRVREILRDRTSTASWLVVAAEPITDIDTTAGEVISDLVKELRARGVTLVFAELKDPVKDRLKRFELMHHIGEQRFFPTLGTAVDAYVKETGTLWTDWEQRALP